MVYFWQRKQRAALTSTDMTSPAPSSASSSILSSLGPSSLFHKGRSRGNSGRQPDNGSGSGALTKNPNIQALEKLEYSRRKQETDRRRVAERELDSLNLKIDKMLSKMAETENDNQGRLKLEEECVVCLAAPATMQTFPCGHKVVCRKCLIKTIQVAVSQRCLPLRCVICRDRILRLHHTMHYHSTTASATPFPSSTLPTFFTPPLSQSSRLSSNAHGAFNPLNMYGPAFGARPTRHTSGQHPTVATAEDSFPKLSHSTNGSLEDDLFRATPADLEAFVHSHNDALNLNCADACRVSVPVDHKTRPKQSAHHAVQSGKRGDHGFMHSQSAKIHPEATNQICSFMDDTEVEIAASASPSSASPTTAATSQRSMSASRFIAKFLPKTSRRKYNWFRHE
ncbi:unnamed protein product [Lymnaea stagnalis]|uniref:RING-type domain-containing protein n=1 Tax=Lymnaea stagnalis TaxID=6523 RepID=A0AAV2H042_LYMST